MVDSRLTQLLEVSSERRAVPVDRKSSGCQVISLNTRTSPSREMENILVTQKVAEALNRIDPDSAADIRRHYGIGENGNPPNKAPEQETTEAIANKLILDSLQAKGIAGPMSDPEGVEDLLVAAAQISCRNPTREALKELMYRPRKRGRSPVPLRLATASPDSEE